MCMLRILFVDKEARIDKGFRECIACLYYFLFSCLALYGCASFPSPPSPPLRRFVPLGYVFYEMKSLGYHDHLPA